MAENTSTHDAVMALIKAAQHFERMAEAEINRLGFDGCPSDPCDYCTAGTDLALAILDVQDIFDPRPEKVT